MLLSNDGVVFPAFIVINSRSYKCRQVLKVALLIYEDGKMRVSKETRDATMKGFSSCGGKRCSFFFLSPFVST